MDAQIFYPRSPQPDATVEVVQYDDDTPVTFHRHVFDDGSVEWQARGRGGNGSFYSWSEINDDAVLVDATPKRVNA